MDWLTKYLILILFKKTFLIELFKYILINRLIRDYSITKLITISKDILFIYKY